MPSALSCCHRAREMQVWTPQQSWRHQVQLAWRDPIMMRARNFNCETMHVARVKVPAPHAVQHPQALPQRAWSPHKCEPTSSEMGTAPCARRWCWASVLSGATCLPSDMVKRAAVAGLRSPPWRVRPLRHLDLPRQLRRERAAGSSAAGRLERCLPCSRPRSCRGLLHPPQHGVGCAPAPCPCPQSPWR